MDRAIFHWVRAFKFTGKSVPLYWVWAKADHWYFLHNDKDGWYVEKRAPTAEMWQDFAGHAMGAPLTFQRGYTREVAPLELLIDIGCTHENLWRSTTQCRVNYGKKRYLEKDKGCFWTTTLTS